jgi:hypothetical protein
VKAVLCIQLASEASKQLTTIIVVVIVTIIAMSIATVYIHAHHVSRLMHDSPVRMSRLQSINHAPPS